MLPCIGRLAHSLFCFQAHPLPVVTLKAEAKQKYLAYPCVFPPASPPCIARCAGSFVGHCGLVRWYQHRNPHGFTRHSPQSSAAPALQSRLTSRTRRRTRRCKRTPVQSIPGASTHTSALRFPTLYLRTYLHSHAKPQCFKPTYQTHSSARPRAHYTRRSPAHSPIVRGEGKAKMRDRPADAGANTKRHTEVGKHSL